MAFNGYVQVPPDGTGKKVGHVVIVELDYTGGTVDFSVGDTITGASSGATGTIVKIDGSTATGELYISLTSESPTAFIIGENLQVNSITRALASSIGSTWYNPTVSIVDHENPFNGVNVTDQGALIITPSEGPFGFDAFGGLQVSQESYLGLYHYNYGIDWGQLYIGTGSAGGSVTTGSNYPGVVFSTPTDSGSLARIRTHLYHPYNAGTGQKWIGSIVVGDTGKTGVIRRWGMFTQENGLFFELSASTMNVVVRNSSTGTTVETRVPQTQWNKDKANGTGGEQNISQANLDASKGFVYFFDFQWLGVGRVRFGIVWSGQKVVLHEFDHNAELSLPYMGQSNLPCCVEQINYDTAGSTSELRTFSMAVIASKRDNPVVDTTRGQTVELTRTVNWTGSFRPLFSVRPKETFLGKENRGIAMPSELKVYSENAPIVFQVHKWPILTDDTWTVPTATYGGLLEGDVTATTASFGTVMLTDIVKNDDVHYHTFDHDWNSSYKIHRKAQITDDNCAWTIMAKLLNNNVVTSSNVTLILDWHEIL
jgi:hypothetical protein